MLNVLDSINKLNSYGLPVVKSLLVSNVNELKKAINIVGKPFVVKANISGHKSDVNGVLVGVNSINDVIPFINKWGSVIVQPLINGREVIIGVKSDESFGKVILVGVGGVITELINDFSLRVCPITKREAVKMINELKTSKLLTGYRGERGVNINSLASLISSVSRLAVKHDFNELDLNPVIVSDEAIIVDARLSFLKY